MQFLDYSRKLSDHIPIKVTIRARGFRKLTDNRLYHDKKALYEHNTALLQAILDSTSPAELTETFEAFAAKEIKKTKFKTPPIQKRIKDLDQRVGGVWRAEQVRKACAQNFDEWFNSNVKDKTRQEFDKNFHLSAKRSVKYKSKGKVLDLIDGPIVSEEDFLQFQQHPDIIDDLDVTTNQSEIRDL